MKSKRNRIILIVVLAMMLAGCGRNDSAKESTAPVVTAAPSIAAAPVETPETEITAPAVSAPSVPPETAAPVQTSGPDQGSVSEPFISVLGTAFVVPEGFIRLDESPSIGYQYTFWHPDHEIRIVIYEIAPGHIPEAAYETDYNIAKNNPDVTYFSNGENWFVQSGYNNNGEEIFYSKESSTDNGLKTLWITYPTVKREFGDPIAAEFEKNCRF